VYGVRRYQRVDISHTSKDPLVVKDAKSPICAREPDSVLHVLRLCPSAQDLWGCGPMRLQKTNAMGRDFNFISMGSYARAMQRRGASFGGNSVT